MLRAPHFADVRDIPDARVFGMYRNSVEIIKRPAVDMTQITDYLPKHLTTKIHGNN